MFNEQDLSHLLFKNNLIQNLNKQAISFKTYICYVCLALYQMSNDFLRQI
jgi:hypothetical protein